MYCRVCGNEVNDNAEICVKCGCRPLNGKEFCQECGAVTLEKQEICTKCGVRLKTMVNNTNNILSGFTFNDSNKQEDIEIDSDFLGLKSYYQKEFQKIHDSNENYKGKFNIWAFLVGWIWAFSKGCWLSAIVCLGISFITGGIGGIVYWFIYGFRGTYMYYCSYVKNKQLIV